MHDTHVDSQYQEDLPVVRPVVHEFRVHVGACATCGRRVQGRHPLQTSDALGAAAVQIGPEAAALVVVRRSIGGSLNVLLDELYSSVSNAYPGKSRTLYAKIFFENAL